MPGPHDDGPGFFEFAGQIELILFCLSLHVVKELSNRVVVDLHGADGAELLAAEALYTLAAVDGWYEAGAFA